MKTDLKNEIQNLKDWQIQDGKLCRTFVFRDFVTAVTFINHITPIAEKLDHHPDIDIRYNKVTLQLITHYAGEITVKDVELAKGIDEIR